MHYDFDQIIPRQGTSSIKWDKYRNTDILPFWVADMDFAVAPEIQQALAERLQHPIYGYTNAPDELVEAFLSHLETIYGWRVSEDSLVWIPGVVAGLSASCRAYLGPGEKSMTHPPIYHHFLQVHEATQNTLVQVPLHKVDDRWTYDLEAIEAAMTPDVRLVLLCSPHNPTGTVFTTEELQSVVALAERHGAVVVSDEIHCGLVLNEETPHVPTALACPDYASGIVTLMSQSKTFNLAGLNSSCAIIENPVLREKFKAACFEVVPHTGTLQYTSAQAAFTHGEPWRQALLAYLRDNLELLRTELDAVKGLKVERCDATYLAWIDVSALGLDDPGAFFEQHGVGFSAGKQFGAPEFVRMNFACPRAQLKEGIRRIAAAVKTLDNNQAGV